jgi:hypothetical protein
MTDEIASSVRLEGAAAPTLFISIAARDAVAVQQSEHNADLSLAHSVQPKR